MYDWPSRKAFQPGPGGSKPPRFNPFVVALPVVGFMLFATGQIDLSQAFGTDPELRQAMQRATEVARMAVEEETPAAGGAGLPTPVPVATTAGSAPPVNAPNEPVAATAGCERSASGFFCLYTVKEGDSLSSIAERFGLGGGSVPGWELLFQSNRPGMDTVDEPLQPGQMLRVPIGNAVVHDVLPGDSVMALAVDYDVSSEAIAAANNLGDANHVEIGDVLIIPEPSQLPPLWVPEASTEEESEAEPGLTPVDPEETAESPEPLGQAGEEDGRDDFGEDNPETGDESPEAGDETPEAGDETPEAETEEPEPAPQPEPEEPRRAQSAPAAEDPRSMDWPVVLVRITNYMTARHPLGMDFGLAGAPTSSIMAAAGGTVTFAGGDPCCSYGLYVIVDHGNGLQTLYAHLSRLGVRKGDHVNRGDSLGIAGNTGYSRGVHLHFEVYRDGKRVDPMLYLPKQ